MQIHYLYYITLAKKKKMIHNTSLFLKAVCSTFITVFDIMENKTIHSMIFFVIGLFFVPSSVTFFSSDFFRFFFSFLMSEV